MRGHDHIIAMRRRGFRPRWAYIDTFADASTQLREWPEWSPRTAQIEVLPSEPLSSLDFRFVIGLPVLITGAPLRRIEAIRDACIECQAERVVTVCIEGGQVVAVTDTSDIQPEVARG